MKLRHKALVAVLSLLLVGRISAAAVETNRVPLPAAVTNVWNSPDYPPSIAQRTGRTLSDFPRPTCTPYDGTNSLRDAYLVGFDYGVQWELLRPCPDHFLIPGRGAERDATAKGFDFGVEAVDRVVHITVVAPTTNTQLSSAPTGNGPHRAETAVGTYGRLCQIVSGLEKGMRQADAAKALGLDVQSGLRTLGVIPDTVFYTVASNCTVTLTLDRHRRLSSADIRDLATGREFHFSPTNVFASYAHFPQQDAFLRSMRDFRIAELVIEDEEATAAVVTLFKQGLEFFEQEGVTPAIDTGGERNALNKHVTIHASDVTVLGALEELCRQSSLRWRLKERNLILSPVSTDMQSEVGGEGNKCRK